MTVWQQNVGNFETLFGFLGFYALHSRLVFMSKQLDTLLVKSRDLFKRYGVKNLTMDDIARELGMSKKTIYQQVENKAELVKKSMQYYLTEEREKMKEILESKPNSVDAMIELFSYFIGQISEFNPLAFHELQKYYPETWEIYIEYRNFYFHSKIVGNIEEGMKQGVYREGLDPDIISKLYINGFDLLLDPNIFPPKKYVFLSVYKEFLNYHLRGILSAKGLKFLEQHNVFKN